MKPLVAIPIGDPAGVGPEITVKALALKEIFDAARCVVVGDKKIIENAIKITGTNLSVNAVSYTHLDVYKRQALNFITNLYTSHTFYTL